MEAIRPTGLNTPHPKPKPQTCKFCGTMLHPLLVERNEDKHPNCSASGLKFIQVETVAGSDHPMRTQLISLIRWVDRTSARSRQLAIGPSEIGASCDRRLAMRMGGVKAVNRTADPWPAIIGTAMHDWLKKAMELDNERLVQAGQAPRWIIEYRVEADPLISGTSDVYDTWTYTVIDWKSMGETAKAKLVKEGPSDGYRIQINTYGLGYSRAGFRVDKVALMFLPRSGRLSDARYFEWPFEPAIAQRAIERVYRVGQGVVDLRSQHQTDDVWKHVPGDPTALCGWCPFYIRDAAAVTDRGCPGK